MVNSENPDVDIVRPCSENFNVDVGDSILLLPCQAFRASIHGNGNGASELPILFNSLAEVELVDDVEGRTDPEIKFSLKLVRK